MAVAAERVAGGPGPCVCTLADGRVAVLRVATDADLAGIMDFFERSSAGSRDARCFSPLPRLRRTSIECVVAPGVDRVTLLAQPTEFRATTRHVVGVGGWVYVPATDRCDVSVAVAEAWRNVRLGTGIVLALFASAVARGHTRFAADVLETDARMLGLLASLGASLRTRREGGVACVELELPQGREDPAVARRACAVGGGANAGAEAT